MVPRKPGRQRAGGVPPGNVAGRRAVPGDEPARPGWPDPTPERLSLLSNRVERTSFSRAEVIRYWQKAAAKARDAQISGLSADTALEAAYDAGRLASTAVLASRHIRARGGQGHHEVVFAAVAALGLPGCDDILADSEEVRVARHTADYHADFASADDLKIAVEWAGKTLPVLRAALVTGDPDLGVHLDAYP